MASRLPEWLRALGYLASGGAVPDNTGGGLTPWGLLRIVAGVFWGLVIAGFIFYAVNTALRNAEIAHHLAIAFAVVAVYAVIAIGMNLANGLGSRNRFW